MPGTNTLTYYEHSQLTAVKSYITLTLANVYISVVDVETIFYGLFVRPGNRN
jgi:hypothetical protein